MATVQLGVSSPGLEKERAEAPTVGMRTDAAHR